MITFSCGFCSRKYRVDDGLAGRKVKCKECGTELAIPAGAAKAPAVDLYGLDEEEVAAPPPPRRPGFAPEAPPGRGGRRPEPSRSPAGESPFRKVGGFLLVLGLLSFVLPLVGLQVKGLHALPPEAQMTGGIVMVALGAVCLLIASAGSSKGLGVAVKRLGLVVGGGAALVVVLGVVVAVFRGPRAPGVPRGRGPNFAAGPAVLVPGRDGGRVAIVGGRAMAGRGPGGLGSGGVSFEIDYRVESRTPGAAMYDLIIKSSRGATKVVPPVFLRGRGTLGVTVPAASRADGPFEAYFEVETFGPGGGTRSQVSDSVALAWTDAPPEENPFAPPGGNPFGGPPGDLPGRPGFRPPGMPARSESGPR